MASLKVLVTVMLASVVAVCAAAAAPDLELVLRDAETRERIPQERLPHPGDLVLALVRTPHGVAGRAIVALGQGDHVVRAEVDEDGEATFAIPQGAVGGFAASASLRELASEPVAFQVQNDLGLEIVSPRWPPSDACEGSRLAVRVRDESGNPMDGATVWFGDEYALTGGDGAASYLLPKGTAGLLLVRALKRGYGEGRANVSVGERRILSVVVHPQKSDDPRQPWKYGTVCRGGEVMVKIHTECFPESELFEVFVESVFIGQCSPRGSDQYAMWEDRNGNGLQEPGEVVRYCSLPLPLSVGPGEHGVSVYYLNRTVGAGAISVPAPDQAEYDWRCGEDPDTVTGQIQPYCRFFVSSTCVANRCYHSWGRNSAGEVFSTTVRTLADDLPAVPGLQVCPGRQVVRATFGGMDLRCSDGVYDRSRSLAPVYARVMGCPAGGCGTDPLRTPGEIVSMDQTNSMCNL